VRYLKLAAFGRICRLTRQSSLGAQATHRTRLEWIKLFIASFAKARRFMNPVHQTAVVTVGDTVEWVRRALRTVGPSPTSHSSLAHARAHALVQVQHFTNDPAVLDRRLTGVQALLSSPRAFGIAPSMR